jgi:hypothetical protein
MKSGDNGLNSAVPSGDWICLFTADPQFWSTLSHIVSWERLPHRHSLASDCNKQHPSLPEAVSIMPPY